MCFYSLEVFLYVKCFRLVFIHLVNLQRTKQAKELQQTARLLAGALDHRSFSKGPYKIDRSIFGIQGTFVNI